MERSINIRVNHTDAKAVSGAMFLLTAYGMATAWLCWKGIGYGALRLSTSTDWILFANAGVSLSASLISLYIAINQICYLKGITERNLNPIAGWLQLALNEKPAKQRTTAWLSHFLCFGVSVSGIF